MYMSQMDLNITSKPKTEEIKANYRKICKCNGRCYICNCRNKNENLKSLVT